MQFFKRRKDQQRPDKPSTAYRVKLSNRDYKQLTECDAALKFWLPEAVEKKIDEMSSFQDTSTSDLVRQILFIHLYGRYDLFGLIERQIDTFNLNKKELPRFSRSESSETGSDKINKPIEKSIADLKVWIPAKMKTDILTLANKEGKKTSQYVRQVIITHLFGHMPHDDVFLDMLPPDGHIEGDSEDKCF